MESVPVTFRRTTGRSRAGDTEQQYYSGGEIVISAAQRHHKALRKETPEPQHRDSEAIVMVVRGGIEPTTHCLEGSSA